MALQDLDSFRPLNFDKPVHDSRSYYIQNIPWSWHIGVTRFTFDVSQLLGLLTYRVKIHLRRVPGSPCDEYFLSGMEFFWTLESYVAAGSLV